MVVGWWTKFHAVRGRATHGQLIHDRDTRRGRCGGRWKTIPTRHNLVNGGVHSNDNHEPGIKHFAEPSEYHHPQSVVGIEIRRWDRQALPLAEVKCN